MNPKKYYFHIELLQSTDFFADIKIKLSSLICVNTFKLRVEWSNGG